MTFVRPAVTMTVLAAVGAAIGCSSLIGDFDVGDGASSTDGGGSGGEGGGAGDGGGGGEGGGGGATKNVGDPCGPSDTCVASQCVDGFCCTSACTDTCAACNVPGKEGRCVPVSGPPHGARACLGGASGSCAGTCDGVTATRCQYPTSACGAAPSCSAGVGTLAGACADGTCNQPMQSCADALCSGPACATVVQVATGIDFACALLSDTSVRCWGHNKYGQLGVGDTNDRLVPTPVPGLTGVTAIGTGDDHACAVLAGGALKCWGANYSHQLGLGDPNSTNDQTAHPTPAPVCASGTGASCVPLTGAKKVTGGPDNTCAIVGQGVQCWGADNSNGQLGIGPVSGAAASVPANANPVKVCGPNNCTGALGDFNGGIQDISAMGYHVCAIDGGGLTYCWGNNGAGETGTANNGTQNNFPQGIPVNIGSQVAIKVSATRYGACAIISDGNTANNLVRCWGYGDSGERGNSTSGTSAYGPAPVTVCASNGCGTNLLGATAIAGGAATNTASTNCAVAGGAVYCWGDNTYGTAGTGTTSATPITFATKTLITTGAIGLGGGTLGNVCAVLNAGGTLRCWGLNTYGQIGDGTTSASTAPKPPTAQKW